MRAFDRFAPYRRKLPAWSFYYHAADPALHAALGAPEAWNPSTYDGDASYESGVLMSEGSPKIA